MKVTILGSGVLIPYPKRGNSGYFLESEKKKILIDGGSGTLRRIADNGLNYRDIDTICYSHLHPDHTIDLIPFLFALKHDPLVTRPKSVDIICPKSFKEHFNKLIEIYGKWVLDDSIQINIKENHQAELIINNLTIRCNPTEHSEHSISFRFEENGRDLFYSGDTDICDELIDAGKGSNTAIIECSFPDDQKTKGHLTPSECGQIASTINCEQLILSHFYPEVLQTNIIKTVSKQYDGNIILADDGMTLEI